MSNKPTPAELDQAKQIYNDVNDYLECLANIIQTQVQEDSEDSEDSEYEEYSPKVSQFLNDYKDYISSLPQVHKQLVNHDDSSSTSFTSSKLRNRFWNYQTLQLLPPNLLGNLKKLCEAELVRDVQVSPSFSTSLPTLDNSNGNNEKLLTNEASPSVTLLKAQLDKYTKEQEKNRIVIRMPNYSFDEPIEEKKVVFVVKKSTALIAAPPTVVVESPKEPEPIKGEIEEKNSIIDEKSEVVEVSEKVLSEKKPRKIAIDFEFLNNFVSLTKFGFSGSQLSTLIWT
ncbi:unnamed protein product [Rhizophagus irregularis]|uniref:Uncharacterized protein n=1 Tax=Rhizophagus irregularis TaxID=588596 RepID=A0A2I1GDP4_9GLOM|nr:hypothetical protein RhiirA4_400284 [Rhizophagus irregularis]CAB4408720.1 unnamed protein product [Rhizophagus irregularis]